MALIDTNTNLGNIEIKQMKNPLVIYHAGCNDGFTAAWCFHHAQDLHEQVYDFHPGVYGKLFPLEKVEGNTVYLVDFSYPREVMKELCKKADYVTVLDHHISAMKDLEGLDKECDNLSLNFDMNRSGAMMAWDFCFMKEEKDMPALLPYIQDRDLWKFKLPSTHEITAELQSHDQTFEIWDDLFLNGNLAVLASSGQGILRKHKKDVENIARTTWRWMFVGEYSIPIANSPGSFASDVGQWLYQNIGMYDVPGDVNLGKGNAVRAAGSYYETCDHRIFSLRSNGKDEYAADVSELAKRFGGGGHKNAAGFKVEREFWTLPFPFRK